MRAGGWSHHEYVGRELGQATIGLVGYGTIAELAAGFGMDRVADDPYVPADAMPAGVDVFAEEPPSVHHPLLEQSNAVLTPYLGGLTNDALGRMSRVPPKTSEQSTTAAAPSQR